MTGGLQRLATLFAPLVEALRDKQLSERLFHADETGWKVFEATEDKANYYLYLWVTQSHRWWFTRRCRAGMPVCCCNTGAFKQGHFPVFLVCDRYSAYKKLTTQMPVIRLAFYWAHVRCDFLDAARSWPDLKAWCLSGSR